MGGDGAPDIVLEGAYLVQQAQPDVCFLLFGDKSLLNQELANYPELAAVSEIIHTAESVSMEDKPGQVLRQGRETSMSQAIEAVKDGRAQAVVR